MPRRKSKLAQNRRFKGPATSDKIYFVNLFSPAHFAGEFYELKSGERINVRCACHQCLPAIQQEALTDFDYKPPEQSKSGWNTYPSDDRARSEFERFTTCWDKACEKLQRDYTLVRGIKGTHYSERMKIDALARLASRRLVVPVPALRSPEAIKLCNQVIAEFNALVPPGEGKPLPTKEALHGRA